MSTIISDRDLLIIEPSLFIGAAAAGTSLLATTDAGIVGTRLTSASADFVTQDIDNGHVAVVNGVAVEVVARIQATELDISLPRASRDDQMIAPGDGGSFSLQIISFARLIDQVQISMLRALGIDPDDPVQPLDVSAILNLGEVGVIIGLRTIQHAFETAAALNPTDASLAARAAMYRERAAQAMRQSAAVIDTNGDGQADATRRLDVVTFVRG